MRDINYSNRLPGLKFRLVSIDFKRNEPKLAETPTQPRLSPSSAGILDSIDSSSLLLIDRDIISPTDNIFTSYHVCGSNLKLAVPRVSSYSKKFIINDTVFF